MDEASGGRVHVALRLVRGAGSGRGMQRREGRRGPVGLVRAALGGRAVLAGHCFLPFGRRLRTAALRRPDRTDEQLD